MDRVTIKEDFKENKSRWQHQLRKKLERDAFNEKYECYCCGIKETLEIHHLIYTGDKVGFFNKKYWLILCEEHHREAEAEKRRKEWEKKHEKEN